MKIRLCENCPFLIEKIKSVIYDEDYGYGDEVICFDKEKVCTLGFKIEYKGLNFRKEFIKDNSKKIGVINKQVNFSKDCDLMHIKTNSKLIECKICEVEFFNVVGTNK